MAYWERQRSRGVEVSDWVSSGTGTFAFAFSGAGNSIYFQHTGAGTGTRENQIAVHSTVQKAISATVVCAGYGATSATFTVYINGVPDSNITGKTCNPSSEYTNQEFTYNFGNTVVPGDTLVFSVATTLNAGIVHRIRDVYYTFQKVKGI